MDAYKCDRCGKLFGEQVDYPQENIDLGDRRLLAKLSLYREVQSSVSDGYNTYSADLCEECAASFKDWVRRGRTQNVD